MTASCQLSSRYPSVIPRIVDSVSCTLPGAVTQSLAEPGAIARLGSLRVSASFLCPRCGRPVAVRQGAVGRTIPCPGCRQPLTIPPRLDPEPAARWPVRFWPSRAAWPSSSSPGWSSISPCIATIRRIEASPMSTTRRQPTSSWTCPETIAITMRPSASSRTSRWILAPTNPRRPHPLNLLPRIRRKTRHRRRNMAPSSSSTSTSSTMRSCAKTCCSLRNWPWMMCPAARSV